MTINANKYIGIPFKDGGRSCRGLDCWGLVRMVYADHFWIQLPDYQIGAFEHDAINQAAKEASGWEACEEETGAVVAFGTLVRKDIVGHVGIYIGDQTVLHAVEKVGVCTARINREPWSSRVIGFYRHKESA